MSQWDIQESLQAKAIYDTSLKKYINNWKGLSQSLGKDTHNLW